MLESHVIQTKGFKNVGGDEPIGFQVAVRCPYYRGIWASLLEGAELSVDGETYGADDVRWTLRGNRFTSAELSGASFAHSRGEPQRSSESRHRDRAASTSSGYTVGAS